MGEFEISFVAAEASDITVRLSDVTGKVVFENSREGFKGNYSQRVDLSSYSAGVYFLSKNINGKITTDRILLNR